MVGTPNTTMAGQRSNYWRVVQEETFDDKGYTNNNSLTQARITNPDSLNPVITHLMGRQDKRFPLLFLTEGQNKGTKYVEIQDVEYDWPVFGRLKRSDVVVGHDYAEGSEPGRITGWIEVVFKTAWLKQQHKVISPNGSACRISGKPIWVGNGY